MKTMKIIKANIWGKQKNVYLTDWQMIKSLGFEPRDRAFGNLNDGTQALFFYSNIISKGTDSWYVTTETMSQILGKTQVRLWVIYTETEVATPLIRKYFSQHLCDSSSMGSCTWLFYDDDNFSVSQELCELLRKNNIPDFFFSRVHGL